MLAPLIIYGYLIWAMVMLLWLVVLGVFWLVKGIGLALLQMLHGISYPAEQQLATHGRPQHAALRPARWRQPEDWLARRFPSQGRWQPPQ